MPDAASVHSNGAAKSGVSTLPLAWQLPLWVALLVLSFAAVLMFTGQQPLTASAVAIDLTVGAIAAVVAFLVVRRSLKPIDTLTQALSDETFDPASLKNQPSSFPEVGRLRDALISRAALQAQAQALAKSESERAREATLARLAAGLAHEVRNPVAGMSAAVSTLRRYGEDQAVREETINLLERGLASIDHVAASMLSTYRPPEGDRALLPDDLNDLRTLLNPKVRVKQVSLEFEARLTDAFPTRAEAVRQIALNLLLNAVDASPAGSTVRFAATLKAEHLSITVADSGSGLPDDALKVLTGGGPAAPQTRRLGLWLVHQLIDDVNGRISIATQADAGTVITITIPPRHAENNDA